jgi:histidinol-phosphate/aromatic aminotransferase/cobyric acid decarboxylase-like protein
MARNLEEIISQIPDRLDQRKLRDLIGRYELLRVLLSQSPQELDVAAEEAGESDEFLQRRVRELRAENARMQETVQEWREWADINVPRHNFLLAEHERLSERVRELDIELRRALAMIPTSNSVLFQTK